MKEKIAKLQEIIDKSNNVVFFGGAGVSRHCGGGRGRCALLFSACTYLRVCLALSRLLSVLCLILSKHSTKDKNCGRNEIKIKIKGRPINLPFFY